jgi:hypothetical protein
MKKALLVTILLFSITLSLNLVSLSPAFAEIDSSKVTPSSPPRVPVTDYDTGSHRIVDLMYIHYDIDVATIDGGSIGFNYVNSYNELAYNLGAGFFYLQGSASDIDLDVYAPALPLNANVGVRLFGRPDTNNLMVFGGLHWTYTWIVITYETHDIYAYGPAYGPLFGAKAELKLSPSVSIIPYYIFQHVIFDVDIEYDGQPVNADVDPVTSHLFGFDIKFSGFSVGALLDTLNNTDNKKITIIASYDFDYSDSSEREKTAKQEEIEKTAKPERKNK